MTAELSTTNILVKFTDGTVTTTSAASHFVVTRYNLQIENSSSAPTSFPTTSACYFADATATTCTIPMSELWASPFSLTATNPVNVKVRAINVAGDGDYSSDDTSTLLTLTAPDKPAALTEDTA